MFEIIQQELRKDGLMVIVEPDPLGSAYTTLLLCWALAVVLVAAVPRSV